MEANLAHNALGMFWLRRKNEPIQGSGGVDLGARLQLSNVQSPQFGDCAKMHMTYMGSKLGRSIAFGGMLCLMAVAVRPAAAGSLFVGDFVAGTGYIDRFDSTTGALLSSTAFPELDTTFPGQMAFGPNGNLFVPNSGGGLPGTIDEFNSASGAFIDQFATAGLFQPSAATFDSSGNLFVADFGPSTQSYVEEFNGTTGAPIGQFIAPAAGLDDPVSLVFGPNGNLFVADSTGSIYQFNGTTGALINIFAFVPAQPEGIVFGPDGNLYVALSTLGEVMRLNGTTGAFIDDFIPVTSTLSGPIGLAFGPNGNLFVADGSSRVAEFDGHTGAALPDFVPLGTLTNPQFLAFSPTAAPEPGSFALLAIGGLTACLFRKRRV
jgi:DNA-binding beta-propeller fold protein YncE